MKKTLVAALLALLSLTFVEAKQRKAEDPVLQFNENGKFKIVQFTDTHLGYNNRPVYDKSVEMITSIVKTEKPDLVIFTGDIVTGAPMKQGLDNLFAPLDEMGVPFMLLLGNHDREDELPAWEIAKITTSHKSSINTMSQDYLDDIALRIKSSDGKKVAAVVYGMDSNDYSVVPDHWDYGWISHYHIDWYRNNSKGFQRLRGCCLLKFNNAS